MGTLTEDQLLEKLEEKTGVSAVTPAHFHTFKDVESNVRRQVARIKNHPYVRDIPVRGFVYDVKSGKLNEVSEEGSRVSRQTVSRQTA
jgi:carbonic anhydrase